KGSEEVASDAISAGVTDYLQKDTGTGQYTVLANRVRNAVERYRAEQARQRQQDAIETALEGISILNSDGEFIYVNRTYADLYGYEPEELLGEPWELIYPDDEVAFVREEILPTVADEGYWHGETTGLRADGTTFPEDHVVSRTNQDELVCTVRDLSARRERETELRLKTRAMDEAPVGITITDSAGDDNPLVYVNDRFEDVTGYDREEILGRDCRFLQGEATADEPVAELREAIDADEPVTVELRNYRKDGTEFWNRVSIAPVDGEGGSASNYVGFQQDITDDRRRRERRKRQHEALLELTTDDAVAAGDFGTAARRITETAADVLDVPRVNIWLVDDDGDDAVFRCVDHYDRDGDEHACGMELDPEAYPAYFEALAAHRVIDAVDARRDPRTAELTDDYLDAHGIGALLDGALRSEGDVVGVICHEQTGGPREWTDDEIEFADDVADIVHRVLRNQERKEHQQELERTNALLSTLIETLPFGVLVEDASRDVLTVNERLFELFDMPGSPDEAVGADCERMAEDVSDAFADPEGFIDRINALVAEREPVTDAELPLRDGRTFARSYEPVELPDGDGHLWVYRDITERKERERKRESTIEFLQSLYDVATDRTSNADEKVTRLLELGPEKSDLPSGYLTRIETGDEAHETGTQRVIEASGDHELLQVGDAAPLSRSYCRKTIETDEVVAIHDALAAGWEGDPAYELFGLDCYIGTKVTVNDDLYGTVFFGSDAPREEPFTDAEKAFVRLMGQLVSYELERDHARRELEQRKERLEEFASTVSHDLRNPLRVAEGRLALGRDECDNEHFESVARAHERMHVLIDDLLALAREGEDATEPEPVPLAECSEAGWRTVETADATLVTDADRTLTADRNKLQQLLENLYRNAVEHGGEDVTVTVGELEDGFYVEDDGSGIPERARDEVFDAGYSTSDEGSGFGLSIVKQVVDAHGWEIRVTGSSGGGARFEITGVEFAAE
ncbi:MAG: PAS domain S-box protein, partial [Haloferacaceae archaeon]